MCCNSSGLKILNLALAKDNLKFDKSQRIMSPLKNYRNSVEL